MRKKASRIRLAGGMTGAQMKRYMKFAAIGCVGTIVFWIVIGLVVVAFVGLVSEESKPEATPVLTATQVLTATPAPTEELLPYCATYFVATKSFQNILDARAAMIPPSVPTPTPTTAYPCRTLSPTSTPIPTRTPVPEPLTVLNFRCYEEHGYAFVDGMVRNNTNMRLENVMAVTSWYTSEGTFISSHDALIDYNPVMPGQESPFQTIGTHNPQMSKCKLSF